jgi:hypothetical protein
MFKVKLAFYFIFPVLEFELRAYTLSHSTSPTPFFVLDFFKIGSCKLFAWAAFKPQFS